MPGTENLTLCSTTEPVYCERSMAIAVTVFSRFKQTSLKVSTKNNAALLVSERRNDSKVTHKAIVETTYRVFQKKTNKVLHMTSIEPFTVEVHF